MGQRICSIEGCGKPFRARGWCTGHYQRWQNLGSPVAGGPELRNPGPCEFEGCDEPTVGRRWCNTHYLRWKRHGDPAIRLTAATPEDAFEMYVEPEGDCLVWTGVRDVKGYGIVSHDRRHTRAHRMSWQLANGPIPDGLVVRHKCDNPPCVKPGHLEIGTQQDNVNDMIARGRAAWQKVSRDR